jgi:hypothetical protein
MAIEYKNGIEGRDQEQGDKSSNGKSADLGITDEFPERATFERERKQSKNCCTHRDYHGANPLNSPAAFRALAALGTEVGAGGVTYMSARSAD